MQMYRIFVLTVVFFWFLSIELYTQVYSNKDQRPSMTIDNKTIVLGWSEKEFQEVFSDYIREEIKDEGIEIITYIPPNKIFRDIIFNFYMDMLFAIDITCQTFNDCYDKNSVYNSITLQIKDQLLIKKEIRKDTKAITIYKKDNLIGYDEKYVGPESGDPFFHFQLIDVNILKYIRGIHGDYRPEIKIEDW